MAPTSRSFAKYGWSKYKVYDIAKKEKKYISSESLFSEDTGLIDGRTPIFPERRTCIGIGIRKLSTNGIAKRIEKSLFSIKIIVQSKTYNIGQKRYYEKQ